MKKVKLTKLQLIIIIVAIAVMVVATAVIVPVVLNVKNGNIVLDTIAVPTVKEDIVLGEPDYTVTLDWDDVLGAVGYHFQYYYDYEVEDVNAVKDKEITTLSKTDSSVTIPRIKGKLHYRLEACANQAKYDSGYGDWVTYEVPALKMELPNEFRLTRVEINKVYTYKVTETSRSNWECVKYIYKGQSYNVDFYEVVIASPENKDNPDFLHPIVFNRASLLSSEYNFDESGVWTIYVRAVNYAEINGEIVPLQGQEIFLSLYDIADEWTKIETTVIV